MSNALLKSKTAMSVWVPVSKEEKRSYMVIRSFVSHEKPSSEAMVKVCYNVVLFKVSHKVAVDYVFKDFTWNRYKGDGTIVFW